MGSAQRAVRGGALLSAFILVGGGDRLRGVLFDVYRALEIAWRPDHGGRARRRGARDHAARRSRAAVLAARGEDSELAAARSTPATLALARTLEERHRWPYDS